MIINYNDFSNTTKFHEGEVPYFTFNNLDKLDFIKHSFSTRLGGVSKGIYSSMNLTFTREDNPDNVSRNFEIYGAAVGIKTENMVYAMQTHTTNVMKVTSKHRGMGVVRERDFKEVDGLVTDEPGIALVTSYADCVPLFFADPVNKAIGLSHSGWRGTVGNIAQATILKLQEEYGSRPEDIIAFIGPSICRNCYEVGEDVAMEFARVYGREVFEDILRIKEPETNKYWLNLWAANYTNFLKAGIKTENIEITDICTCCNKELLFSHRGLKGKRGGLCGFMQIL